MLKLIDRFQTHDISQFSPKKEAIDDFITHKDQFMQNTVWNDPAAPGTRDVLMGPSRRYGLGQRCTTSKR